MKELIGKIVTSLRVNDDQSILVFDHSDNTCTSYETKGDCCSETWFADIIGVCALIGGKVIDVEEVNLSSVEDGRTRQEEDIFYGVKLRTDKGFLDIIYRNSSNGYYGGNIVLYSGPLPKSMHVITDDWMA